MQGDVKINERVTIPAQELEWQAVRSSGPGGQNVNKVASKVDLRFDLRSSRALSAAAKDRLRGLVGGRLDARGRVIVVSQKTRDQSRNLEDARMRLAELVRRALVPPKHRRATAPTKGSVRRRLDSKTKRASLKRTRQTNWDD